MTDCARYPLDPIARHLGITLHQVGGHQADDPAAGATALAEHLQLASTAHVRRLAQRGLSERQADRYATTIGLHPANLWPDWWANTDGEPDDWHHDDPTLDELEHQVVYIQPRLALVPASTPAPRPRRARATRTPSPHIQPTLDYRKAA